MTTTGPAPWHRAVRLKEELRSGLQSDLFDVVRRQREEGVQPVGREDVAQVLRRRLFDADSLLDSGAQDAQVIGVVGTLARVDASMKKNRREEEDRFRRSYPFHPDLGDVFYSRWTQLTGFQRTRGILRTLATALREAERWDECPVIGPAALLAAPEVEGVSEAIGDLAGISTAESSEGAWTDWRTLLEKELQIAQGVQRDVPTLSQREAEQAVVAVFLHSQPIGHKANTPELVRLVGAGAPDAIELEKALGGWRALSWFLDDADLEDDEPAGGIPKSWRLGNRPNLKQMHDEACTQRVTADAVERRLAEEVHRTRRLTEGARATGAQVHNLPKSPADLGDNDEFRYAVLGPEAASESGKPSAVASRYLAGTTGADKPRVHRNVVVLTVPSRDGLAAAREVIRSLLGWEDVQTQLAGYSVDPVRSERLRRRLEKANVVIDTVVQGIDRGLFVAELSRPDGSRRTWWREVPPREVMDDDQLRVVLPEKAELAELPAQLLAPGAGALPGLWDDESVTLGDAITYFRGGHAVTVPRDGYDEVEIIPRCAEEIVREAIRTAVSQGLIWLANGPTTVWYEPVPEDALTPAATLRARPERIPVTSLVEDVLPGAWYEGFTNGVDLTRALSQMRGEALPWGLVRESILAGVDSRWLQVKDGDAVDLQIAYRDAGRLVLERPSQDSADVPPSGPVFEPTVELEAHQIHDLADLAPELMEASAGYQLKFRIQVVLDDAPENVRTDIEQLVGSRLKTGPSGDT